MSLEERAQDLAAEETVIKEMLSRVVTHRPPPIVITHSKLKHKMHAMLWGLRHCVPYLHELALLCQSFFHCNRPWHREELILPVGNRRAAFAETLGLH